MRRSPSLRRADSRHDCEDDRSGRGSEKTAIAHGDTTLASEPMTNRLASHAPEMAHIERELNRINNMPGSDVEEATKECSAET